MSNAHDKIKNALKDLEEGQREAAREMYGLKALVNGLPCDSYELLQILDELADAEEDCNGHHRGRFSQEETSKPYDEQSQECRDDWTRCYNRREKAIRAVTQFATALRKGELAAA
jgi:hypothetical protein